MEDTRTHNVSQSWLLGFAPSHNMSTNCLHALLFKPFCQRVFPILVIYMESKTMREIVYNKYWRRRKLLCWKFKVQSNSRCSGGSYCFDGVQTALLSFFCCGEIIPVLHCLGLEDDFQDFLFCFIAWTVSKEEARSIILGLYKHQITKNSFSTRKRECTANFPQYLW